MTIQKRSIGRALALTALVLTVLAGGAAAGNAVATARANSQAAAQGTLTPFLSAAARHLKAGGRILLERHDPRWLEGA